MAFAVLIGSYARGDFDERSDCDVLLVNLSECAFDKNLLPTKNSEIVNYINYDSELFEQFYNDGSLFLYHALYEGLLLMGDEFIWQSLKDDFSVQKRFTNEINNNLK